MSYHMLGGKAYLNELPPTTAHMTGSERPRAPAGVAVCVHLRFAGSQHLLPAIHVPIPNSLYYWGYLSLIPTKAILEGAPHKQRLEFVGKDRFCSTPASGRVVLSIPERCGAGIYPLQRKSYLSPRTVQPHEKDRSCCLQSTLSAASGVMACR